MEVIQASSKSDLMRQIGQLDKGAETVYINARPSMDIVMRITEAAPDIREIYCPPSLLKQTSTKVFSVLESKNIKLSEHAVRVGRPAKYSDTTVNDIMNRREAGMAVKEIARDMRIPLRTVYYYLKNNGH